MTPDPPRLDPPTVGRPQLGAVRDPLARNLSDLLYQVGADLMTASRLVERRQVDDYRAQGEVIGTALFHLVLLHGQLASLDELEGGKMHGTARPTFPEPDRAVSERLAAFQATRTLERTQQRPWVEPDDDGPEEPA